MQTCPATVHPRCSRRLLTQHQWATYRVVKHRYHQKMRVHTSILIFLSPFYCSWILTELLSGCGDALPRHLRPRLERNLDPRTRARQQDGTDGTRMIRMRFKTRDERTAATLTTTMSQERKMDIKSGFNYYPLSCSWILINALFVC